jgi:LuxR family maltose regulon positive regulatory protein
MLVVRAALRLAYNDPESVTSALEPLIATPDAEVPNLHWWIHALLLEAVARDAQHEPDAASQALERALDLAAPHGVKLPFLLSPATELLERHRRKGTAHAPLVADLLKVLAGRTPAASTGVEALPEPLSECELRVLRYLPTGLQVPEIAGDLYVSVNTVRTHIRRVYAKLGVHQRADAVQRARDLRLLGPAPGPQ